MLWLIAANPKKYNVELAFKELQYVDWKKNSNYKTGDTIFIYVSKPIQAIKYVCEVVNDNINGKTYRDDRKYWVDQIQYESGLNGNGYVRLKLIKEFDNDELTLEKLASHGLNGRIQGPRKFYNDNNNLHTWAEYILNYQIENTLIHNLITDNSFDYFWKKFEDKAFANNIFSSLFFKTKTHNRSYYDVSWRSNDVHLVIRYNSQNKWIEIYIRRSKSIFQYYLSHIKELENDLSNHLEVTENSLNNSTKHKKLILKYPHYNIDQEQFIDWCIKECIQIKNNIDTIDSNMRNEIKKEEVKIDTQLQLELSNEKKSNNIFEYSDEPVEKPDSTIVNNIIVYQRDKQIALNALNHANYTCEIDKNHRCFLKKDGETPYTEAHHLIPLSFQDEFEYSLDVEQNIVSLCSNCHNEIHYGYNAKELIKKLYEERKDLLKAKKIPITLEKLYEYYGY